MIDMPDTAYRAAETPTEERDHASDLRILEALIFASDRPLDGETLAAQLPEGCDLGGLIADLDALYRHRGVNLVQVAGGWIFRTAPDLAGHLTVHRTVRRRPSRAALETLAIIAYHQPVTRAEIEEIRGVGLSRGTLDLLLEAAWIAPKGRRQSPGRPVTWVTTAGFLEHFGLVSVEDLPGVDELKAAGLLDSPDTRLGETPLLDLDGADPAPDADGAAREAGEPVGSPADRPDGTDDAPGQDDAPAEAPVARRGIAAGAR